MELSNSSVSSTATTSNGAASIPAAPHRKNAAQQTRRDSPYQQRIRRTGWRGVTHPSQLEALTPYLDYLPEFTIYTFWELCNDRGWFDLRRRLFDYRTERGNSRLYLDEDRIKASLDEMLADPRKRWIDHWIELYLKTGAATEQVLATVQEWLTGQSSLAALELAATVVIQVGRRKDVHILDLPIEPKSAVHALIADVTFAVRRRRLYDAC